MASSTITVTTFSSTLPLILAILVGFGACESNAKKAPPSRAFFVFGDSLVDSGNNNFLATIARADYPPYGLDYPGHQPTGRFSNGLNFPDLLAEAMGLEHPWAYLDPQITTENLLDGANFASAGVGILDDTGFQFANIVKIYRQLELFEEYQGKVSKVIGEQETKKLVGRSMVLITLGGNDFVNNYFLLPFSARRQQYSLPAYCILLIAEYKKILRKLHRTGARRILVTGTGPLGCVPAELAMYMSPDGRCIEEQQRAASMFNPLLSQMVLDLNAESDSDPFVFSNAFDLNMGLITDPQKFGFASSKMACCGQGPYNGMGLCTPLSRLCPNRDAYVFWDPFHPSEKALRLIVSHMMNASSEFMNPMNLSTIMALDY